jgi:acetoin utilization protein AcuB
MQVKDYMTRHPIMVPPSTAASEAQKIMVENRVRHLPVVGDGKRLLGLVTRQRLRIPPADLGSLSVWEISRFLSNLTVQNVMIARADLVTADPELTLEAAAHLMVEHKIGCLPVLEEGIVIGIITETDMLLRLSDLLGGAVHGVRVTMRVPDRVGEFSKLTSAISGRGWGMYASGSMPSPKQPGFWDVLIKVRNVPKDELISVLSRIEGQEIIDVREI